MDLKDKELVLKSVRLTSESIKQLSRVLLFSHLSNTARHNHLQITRFAIEYLKVHCIYFHSTINSVVRYLTHHFSWRSASSKFLGMDLHLSNLYFAQRKDIHHLSVSQDSLSSSESSIGSEGLGPLPTTTLADLCRAASALPTVQNSFSSSLSDLVTHSLSQSTSSSETSYSRSQSPNKVSDNKCHICPYITNRRSNLLRHLETMHKNQEDHVRVEMFPPIWILSSTIYILLSPPHRALNVAIRCSQVNRSWENIKDSLMSMDTVVSSVRGLSVGKCKCLVDSRLLVTWLFPQSSSPEKAHERPFWSQRFLL